MPVSNRNQFIARNTPPEAQAAFEYEITDPHHAPDLNGEFAGGKVYRKNGKQCVRVTAAHAKFYVDQGALRRV